MKLFNIALLSCVLVCVACFSGCQKNDGLCAVEGTVTLDGQPIEDGYIEMGPMAGQSGTGTGGPIVKGAYKIRASAGEMVVGVRASKTITLTEDEMTEDEKAHQVTERTIEMIPEKYNRQSELRATITTGKNVVNFDLTTDAAE